MTADVKQGILGKLAVGTFNKQRVQKEVEEKGHPLFWGEWKPTQLWTTLFAEFGATEIADFTAGTGATTVAALLLGRPLQGFLPQRGTSTMAAGLVAADMFVACV